nr:MAG TPA: hypothetical protein [Caudoviricetes sp.]
MQVERFTIFIENLKFKDYTTVSGNKLNFL